MVYLHWGVEGHACPSPSQRILARDLADAGADVVVGSHTHVLQGAGWLGDTYVDYGLGDFLWYHDGEPDSGILRVRIEDGHAVSDHWAPARIPPIGPPAPVHGDARTEAVARWRSLRGCAGLASHPTSAADHQESLPAYDASVRRVDAEQRDRMLSTHGRGCPVPWADLRSLHVSDVGFDGEAHTGEVVVAADHARDVVGVFARLYEARWPIRRLRPASDFGGDDERSMAADNTSGFNCRHVAGSDALVRARVRRRDRRQPGREPRSAERSRASGRGRNFARLDRTKGAPVPHGTIQAGDVVVEAFAEIGWDWGGTWTSPDYQHFYTAHPRTAR